MARVRRPVSITGRWPIASRGRASRACRSTSGARANRRVIGNKPTSTCWPTTCWPESSGCGSTFRDSDRPDRTVGRQPGRLGHSAGSQQIGSRRVLYSRFRRSRLTCRARAVAPHAVSAVFRRRLAAAGSHAAGRRHALSMGTTLQGGDVSDSAAVRRRAAQHGPRCAGPHSRRAAAGAGDLRRFGRADSAARECGDLGERAGRRREQRLRGPPLPTRNARSASLGSAL